MVTLNKRDVTGAGTRLTEQHKPQCGLQKI